MKENQSCLLAKVEETTQIKERVTTESKNSLNNFVLPSKYNLAFSFSPINDDLALPSEILLCSFLLLCAYNVFVLSIWQWHFVLLYFSLTCTKCFDARSQVIFVCQSTVPSFILKWIWLLVKVTELIQAILTVKFHHAFLRHWYIKKHLLINAGICSICSIKLRTTWLSFLESTSYQGTNSFWVV